MHSKYTSSQSDLCPKTISNSSLPRAVQVCIVQVNLAVSVLHNHLPMISDIHTLWAKIPLLTLGKSGLGENGEQ